MSEFVMVKRELLEVIANSSERTIAEINDAIQQARAVLAQEAGHVEEPLGMVEAVAVVRRVKADVSERYEGVILASAILSGSVEDGTKLYASPPAPVSVDAAKAFAKGFNTLEQAGGKYKIVMQFAGHDDAWAAYGALGKLNACLDKVKELNQ